jgi:hypothetical protein
LNSINACLSSSIVSKYRTHKRFSFSVRINLSAHPSNLAVAFTRNVTALPLSHPVPGISMILRSIWGGNLFSGEDVDLARYLGKKIKAAGVLKENHGVILFIKGPGSIRCLN